MPQMSPIYRLILMMYFISMMMLLIMIIFFYIMPSMKTSLMTINNSMNWMW